MSEKHQEAERLCCEAQLDRIEAKLDALILAPAEDEDERPTHDMDGDPIPYPTEAHDTL